jgi:hypothetical protein
MRLVRLERSFWPGEKWVLINPDHIVMVRPEPDGGPGVQIVMAVGSSVVIDRMEPSEIEALLCSFSEPDDLGEDRDRAE